MLTIETKISGWAITKGYEDIELLPLVNGFMFCPSQLTNPKSLEWIVKHFNLYQATPPNENPFIYTILNYDDLYKITIMDKYPAIAQELEDRFGIDWANHYLRFGH